MERALGIGGIFLRADDPQALRAWYEANLGIPIESWGGNAFTADAGDMTVWSIIPAAGAEVDDRVEEQEFGRFGWATDPEGNRIELWQPATS